MSVMLYTLLADNNTFEYDNSCFKGVPGEINIQDGFVTFRRISMTCTVFVINNPVRGVLQAYTWDAPEARATLRYGLKNETILVNDPAVGLKFYVNYEPEYWYSNDSHFFLRVLYLFSLKVTSSLSVNKSLLNKNKKKFDHFFAKHVSLKISRFSTFVSNAIINY